MRRRGNSTIHPFWIFGILILIIIAMGGGYFLYSRVNDPYRTIAPLDVDAYLENSNSLKGNTYKFTGAIMNSLAWSASMGRLFSVEVKSSSSSDIVPVLFPTQLNHLNVQKGQRFSFKIEVNDKGILKAQDVTKA